MRGTITIAVALSALTISTIPSDARSRRHRHSEPSAEVVLLRKVIAENAAIRKELSAISKRLRPEVAAVAEPQVQVAALETLPIETPKLIEKIMPRHVMPATATQRGQFNDRRRTHRHAGIDLGGAWGSEIVASFGGVVLPAPGRDRGYGPHVIVIRGDDGIAYRYAHLSSVAVRIGDHVSAGQRLGAMGKVGAHGFPHLHFEMMRVAEYRRRPYGVHGLDPNDYLGGGRGTRMAAGEAMRGEAAVAYARAHAPQPVAKAE